MQINKEKKSVLFLMFAFPNMDKSFNMYTSLVKKFHDNNYKISIVAPQFDGLPTKLQTENGIEVLRVKTLPIKNVSNIVKGVSNVLLPNQFEKAIKKHFNQLEFDWIVLPTPPITLGKLAIKLSKKFKANIYLILRDIFPQNAVDLNFMKENSVLHKFFRKKEEKLYQSANLIGCMSEGNIEYVKKHNNFNNSKLRILRNWQEPYVNQKAEHIEILKDFNLEDKFVVVFGGNMGKPQQLENVLQLARNCEKLENVLFVLLGEGVAMNVLAKKIKDDNYANIRIQGTMPKSKYQDFLKACNLGLISLHKNFTIPNIPSKALDYFNVGLPILASIDSATDFDEVLIESKSGLSSIAGDHESFYNSFQTLYSNAELRNNMSEAGKRYFKDNLTAQIAFERITSQMDSFNNSNS